MADQTPASSQSILRWREMSQAQRDREYSPSSCLPDGDYRPFVAEYRRASDLAWTQLGDRSDAVITTVRYGRTSTQTVDVAVPAGTPAPPLLVYFHGGYWQELSKLESRFAAVDCIERGWAFATVDYTLAPSADLAAIVAECGASLQAVRREAASLGFDDSRVFLSGSSAGAHLAAMVAIEAEQPVRGAILVSGVFELEPLIGTSINDALGLDSSTARHLSPLHRPLDRFPQALLVYGDNETAEFKAQSHVFASRLDRADVIEIPGRNHFDVILDLATPGTVLGDAVAALMEPHADL